MCEPKPMWEMLKGDGSQLRAIQRPAQGFPVAAKRAEGSMNGWRPIGTAPKADESGPLCEHILAYWPGGVIESVYWARGGWYLSNVDDAGPWADPTHWMPLPAPPTPLTNDPSP